MVMAGKMIRILATGLFCGACLSFGQDMDVSGDSPAADTLSSEVPNKEVQTPDRQPSAVQAGMPVKNASSLFFALDEGQVMRGVDNSGARYATVNRSWQQRMYLHLTNDMTYQERLHFILSFECQLTFSFLQVPSIPATLSPLFYFYPNDVEINYAFGNLEKPWMKLAVGYFPFKYNPDVKHLGEYLMRSEAYPNYIVSNFEFAMTRELGLHLSGNSGWLMNPAIDEIKWDLLFTSETHSYSWPTQDWTLTGIVSNNLFNFLDIGGGVSLQRLFSVDEAKTSPKKTPNRYFGEAGITDTNYISFKATKLMGRAAVNPQRFIPEFKIPFWPLFGETPFFGKEDLRVYGEAAVLGLDNYMAYDSVVVDSTTMQKAWLPASKIPINNYGRYYDSLPDRMPYMIGLNLPTNPIVGYGILPFILTKWLKDETGDDIRPLAYIMLIPALASGVVSHYLGWDLGLDELSLEFEWTSQRFPNSNRNAIDFGNPNGPMPIPTSNATRLQSVPNPMQVKYALYFKKSFMDKRFALSGLVSRDHMRPAFHGPEANGVTDDFLQANNHWWWAIRLSANF
jgi:hypothetical protein